MEIAATNRRQAGVPQRRDEEGRAEEQAHVELRAKSVRWKLHMDFFYLWREKGR